MPTFESSTVIAAEASAVWSVLSDVVDWPRWLPTVRRVVPLDCAAMAPGARFVVYQPKLRPATWKVTRLEPPRRFVWEARSPGFRMLAEHVVNPQPPASSAVVLRFSFDGLLGGLMGKLFRSLIEGYLAQEAAALKLEAERCRERKA
ncbi:MAG TPA: SRPBCC family protein [Gammaproteobacteria bacterium]